MCGPEDLNQSHTHGPTLDPELLELARDTSYGHGGILLGQALRELSDRPTRRQFGIGGIAASALSLLGKTLGPTSPQILTEVGEKQPYAIPTFHFDQEPTQQLEVVRSGFLRRQRYTSQAFSTLNTVLRRRAALHTHGHASEEAGSTQQLTDKHLYYGIEVASETNHTHREEADPTRGFLRDFAFSSLNHDGWNWPISKSGNTATGTDVSIGSTQAGDGTSFTGLRLHTTSGSAASAGVGLISAEKKFKGAVDGRHINMRLTNQKLVGQMSRFELTLALSTHNDKATMLVYRFGNFAARNDVVNSSKGLVAYCYRPLPAGDTDIALTPLDEITACFSSYGHDPYDHSFTDIRLDAVADDNGTGTGAEAQFALPSIDLPRDYSGMESRQRVAATIARVASGTGILQLPGEEMGDTHHGNVVSTTFIDLADFMDDGSATLLAARQRGMHPSTNHTWGTSGAIGPVSSSRYYSAYKRMMKYNYYNASVIEVYPGRGGANWMDFSDLRDAGVQAGVWLGIQGVDDDHNGVKKDTKNTTATDIWTTDDSMDAALVALRSTNTTVVKYNEFAGSFRCDVQDVVSQAAAPMGAIIYNKNAHPLTMAVTVDGLELVPGGTVELRRVPINYTPPSGSGRPNTAIVSTYTASDVVGGMINVPLDTSGSYDYYLIMRNKYGAPIAQTNSIATLRTLPSATAKNQIPVERFYDFSGASPAPRNVPKVITKDNMYANLSKIALAA